MNPVIGQQKQSGGYKIASQSPSKTAKRSRTAIKPSGALAGASGAAQPELHRIMSLFQ